VDYRSDQFAFGSILYEMATGKRAFERGTTAETLTAIIREEPEPVSQLNARIPAPVRWIVERCLAKEPEDRYGTTKDLSRDLAQIRDHLSEAPVSGEITGRHAVEAPRGRRALLPILAGVAVLAAVGAVAFFTGRKTAPPPPLPSFHQLTFRRGAIGSARFAPDGQTVFYGAAWDGGPFEIFSRRPESPESRPFGLTGADVLSISASGEMALSLNRRFISAFSQSGTLARMSVAGGVAPREIQEEVQYADWAPDGKSLAIVRDTGLQSRLEFPVGKLLYETSGWIGSARISPSGNSIAFMNHPSRGDDGGTIDVVDRAGARKTLTVPFESGQGIAWSPLGDEIWFTAAILGNRAMYAVTPAGKMRLLERETGSITLLDVSRTGRVLLTHDTERNMIAGLAPGETRERNLPWLDWSTANDLSSDGKTFLFSESGEGGGPGYSTYIRKTDGSPAVRLGEGAAATLSPDGRFAMAILGLSSTPRIAVYPTGAGEPQILASEGLAISAANWMPDGKRILFLASEPGRGARIYVRDMPEGKPRAITPPGYRFFIRTISPDGKFVSVQGPDRKLYLYPLDGGEPKSLEGLTAADTPVGWTADGRALYVFRRDEMPVKVYRFDVSTGKRELWREIAPSDGAGVTQIARVYPTPDGKAYIYSFSRVLSDLYVVEGIK
jgi:Tol biopolymer transport system component